MQISESGSGYLKASDVDRPRVVAETEQYRAGVGARMANFEAKDWTDSGRVEAAASCHSDDPGEFVDIRIEGARW